MTQHAKEIIVYDRITRKSFVESVYKEGYLHFLYGNTLISRTLGRFILHLFVKKSLFSKLYGLIQKLPYSRKNIAPFIEKFQVDASEFISPPSCYKSFNDFFIRKLKPESRPIFSGERHAIIPADGRYLFYSDVQDCPFFSMKGKTFSLLSLLKDKNIAEKYSRASMVIARLCPYDYHRFHFPVNCLAKKCTLINGYLYAVNPIALRHNKSIFSENKRMLTELASPEFGSVLWIEIGATNVASIQQTYTPETFYKKGDEKGFFSFGGSSLIILFPKQRIVFDQDLMELSKQKKEIRCLMGQSMGQSLN